MPSKASNITAPEGIDKPALPALSPEEAIAREAVAQWMIKHSYATGHGDTLNNLLLELVSQARQTPEARLAAAIAILPTGYGKPNLLNKNNNM